jgi:hypothetical protein
VGVLQGQTDTGFHSKALGGFEIRIGSGFAGRVVSIRHDYVEPIDQIMSRQVMLDGFVRGGRCNGPREAQFVQGVEQFDDAWL